MPPSTTNPVPPLRSIVVFCPNLIGDTVMATPAIRALRRAHPDARIAAVVKPHVAPTLDGNPWFDETILFNPKSAQPSERLWALVRRLRAARFDAAVLLPNSIRTALAAWLGRVPRRVGYDHGGRAPFLTDRLLPPRRDGQRVPVPAVSSYLEIVRRLGARPDSTRLELFTTPDDERAADHAWDVLGLPRDTPRDVVCLNTGGAFGPAKNWPVEHFAELARRLALEDARPVLVLCGPAERENARAIVKAADHPRVVGLHDLPVGVGLTKAAVKRAGLLVTTDSGPRHFAAAFDVPVVSLFGPTWIAWTRTWHPRAWHLQVPVPCGPCQKPVCPLVHHRCMRELAPDRVLEVVRRVIGHPRA